MFFIVKGEENMMDQYLEVKFEVLKQQIVKKEKQSNLQVRSLSREFFVKKI